VTTSGIGHALLLVTVLASAAAAAVSWRRPMLGRRLLYVTAMASAVATILLSRALVQLDFSLVYVAEAARRGASRPFRLAGLWGGMAGSLLLWTTVTAVVTVWALRRIGRALPSLVGTTQSVAAAIILGLAVTVRWASDPFATLNIPATDGGGIVPILEHPAMLIHPPLLYIGLALTMPLFALTIAAQFHSAADEAWSRSARSLALTSWCIITVAMALGAAWANDELGWGGFWAWDPVENGVLLPWLALTAFVHARQRAHARRLTVQLPIIAFLLASLGGLLSRSGAVASVHAFAEADRVGHFLAVSAALTVALCVAAFVRSQRVTTRRDGPSPAVGGTDRLLVGNAIVLLGMTAVVFIGTVWPVVRGWSGGQKRAIDPIFYVRFAVPGAAMLLALMAVDAARSVRASRSLRGRVAHLGLALFVVGAAAGSFGHNTSVTVRTGDTVQVGSTALVVGTPVVITEADYQRITVPITFDNVRLLPLLRIYEQKALRLSRPDRTMGLVSDVQVAVRGVNADGFIQIEAHSRPLLWAVWLGVVIMVIGGILALTRRVASPQLGYLL
jgi:cytochrome c-type biogenesis protein CcmF